MLKSRHQLLYLRLLVKPSLLDLLAQELYSLSCLSRHCLDAANILIKNCLRFALQFFNRARELKLSFSQLEPRSNSLEHLLGQFFGFDSLDKVRHICGFQFFHGIDKPFMLNFPQDMNFIGEFLQSFAEGSASFGEGLPVHKGILSGQLQDLLKTSLDILNLDITHHN